jgi:trimethylamine:corrinoid methyltransferase-like protein
MKIKLHKGLVPETIHSACNILLKKGIKTRNPELLKNAAANEHLVVKSQRIFVSGNLLDSCLAHLKSNRVPPTGEKVVMGHDWRDMIINKADDREVVIKITDLPYQFCDHRKRKINRLTRELVISGTKLLHVLSEQNDIRGYSCGVPQDTHAYLKPVEQYLIGFRYNRNGGGTIQSVAPDVEEQFAGIRAIAEDWEDDRRRDLMLFSPSPMILDAEDLYLCFKKGIRLNSFMVGSMPMMGMTGPVDPVGVYILALGEALGAACVLHALFPEAKAYVYPHPQAMSLETGQMAFGTIEHARLEMIKIEVMEGLGLPYYNLKDIMTSAQMPGSLAQGDKALGFYTGIIAGYRAFNLMPLSTDQVWSPVQALLDIENLQSALKSLDFSKISGDFKKSEELISEVNDSEGLFGEHADTLVNMLGNYETDLWQRRYFSSETWNDAGAPHELESIESKVDEMIGSWNYRPNQEKLERIIDIYLSLCRRYHTEPMKLD